MGRRLGQALVAAALALLLPAVFAQVPTPPAKPPHLIPLEVVVNGADSGTWLLLESEGALYAPQQAFEEWRLQRPTGSDTLEFRGQRYWPLSTIPGFRSRIDYAQQKVELAFAPQAFAALRLSHQLAERPKPGPVLPTFFVNYEANVTDTAPRGGSEVRDFGVLHEVGLSTSLGVLTSSGLARNLAEDPKLPARHDLRLETTFTRDFPEQNRTLRLGDTTTRAAMWGRDVYFGGLRFGTNFALTPGFVSQPLPVIQGLSAAPSTVELYVNDVLRQVSKVPTGPFAIDNLPVLTGNGEARIVVHDLLGRETVLVQSFFTSSELLSKGLSDWSVEAGAVRNNLGTESNDYGERFASGTWRHGFTDSVTLESRGELGRDFGLLGSGLLVALPVPVLLKMSLAGSHYQGNDGGLWLLGLEHAGQRLSASIQAQGMSRRFRQLGQDPTVPSIKLQFAGNVTYYTESGGTFGLGFATLHRWDADKITTLTANYGVRLGKSSTLSATLSRAIQGGGGTAMGMNFVMPLDAAHVASVTANARGGQQDLYASMSSNPGPNGDIGWRLLAGELQNHNRAEGGYYYFGPSGNRTIDVALSSLQNTVRVGANGGVVFADGKVFATRRLEESFALAEVPGYADIGIGLGSNVLAHTDESGIALVPRLQPYQNNAIRLDPKELPVNAELDTIEINAVPAWRSAVKVKFPVRSGRGALLTIDLDDGQPAPAGATVRIDGDKEEFYVARRGAAYVTGLEPDNRLVLNWNGQECRFEVKLPPPDKDTIPRLGPFACRGVSR